MATWLYKQQMGCGITLRPDPPEICELGNPQVTPESPHGDQQGPLCPDMKPLRVAFIGSRQQSDFLKMLKCPFTHSNTPVQNFQGVHMIFHPTMHWKGQDERAFPSLIAFLSCCTTSISPRLGTRKLFGITSPPYPSAWFYIKSAQRSVGRWWKQVSCCARGSQLGTMTTVCLLEQRMPFV